jgi:hypothetical protein
LLTPEEKIIQENTRLSNIFLGNNFIDPKLLLQNIKVVEGKYFKTFLLDDNLRLDNNFKDMPSRVASRKPTFFSKRSSAENLQHGARMSTPLNVNYVKRKLMFNNTEDIKISNVKLEKNFNSNLPSPKGGINTTIANQEVCMSPKNIIQKYGLKLPNIKAHKRTVSHFLTGSDFYYK